MSEVDAAWDSAEYNARRAEKAERDLATVTEERDALINRDAKAEAEIVALRAERDALLSRIERMKKAMRACDTADDHCEICEALRETD